MAHDQRQRIGEKNPVFALWNRGGRTWGGLNRGLGFLAAMVVAGCQTLVPPPPPPPPPPLPLAGGQTGDLSSLPRDWRGLIVSRDLDRYQRLEAAWTLALKQAREMPGSGNLRSLGDLITPGAGLDYVMPPTGDYRCRTIKLGTQSDESGLGYVVYGWFACRIEMTTAGLKLSKLSGSQRPSGIFFPENNRQMVFLGSMALASEPAPRSYGERPARDMVGVLERIEETRWRLVIPWPNNESNLDLIELVPAPRARR